MSETLKNTCEEVNLLVNWRLEAYIFTKNELICRHFSDDFT